MLAITSADYLQEYKFRVRFNDGADLIFDFFPIIEQYTVFKALKDINVLKSYSITDTFEWNGGELDIAPEYIRQNGIPA